MTDRQDTDRDTEAELPLTEVHPDPFGGLVDDAIDAAGQVILATPDATLAQAGEIAGALMGPAMRAVLDMRVEQIAKHGHTIASDDGLTLGWLPKEARDYAAIAVQCIGVTGNGRNLPRARRSLAKTAALCMAAIDRLDRAIASGEAA